MPASFVSQTISSHERYDKIKFVFSVVTGIISQERPSQDA
jgi:hypothetical protein